MYIIFSLNTKIKFRLKWRIETELALPKANSIFQAALVTLFNEYKSSDNFVK